MKGNYLKLNNEVNLDLEKLIESRLLIQANSGGGKSWAMRLFIEGVFGRKQLIIIDPEGEFGNLRTKYDFVYIAKGGDAPADPRSAGLLLRKLLETKANAIIDIFELGHQRGDFVKALFDAAVNMPKELWTDAFFLLDEAHKFAPEKGQGESVALSSVIDMASLGRKRGYCLIPATQRPAKLSKDVVAECNNKLIGRASLDIDRERSAKELGFNTKEQILSLRNLEPGEFYAFGPAISNEIIKIKLGDVKVKPPKRGAARSLKIAPPTAKIKAILAKLADLPAEAKKEAMTLQELKSQLSAANTKIRTLERAGTTTKVDPAQTKKEVDRALTLAERENQKEIGKWTKYADFLETKIREIVKNSEAWVKQRPAPGQAIPKVSYHVAEEVHRPTPVPIERIAGGNFDAGNEDNNALGAGPKKILAVIAQHEDGITRQHITIVSGYRRSTRDIYLQKLQQGNLVRQSQDKFYITDEGIAELGDDYEVLPTGTELREKLMKELPVGEKRILAALIESYPNTLTRQAITDFTSYPRSTRDIYLQKLNARKLIDIEGGEIKASDKLFD